MKALALYAATALTVSSMLVVVDHNENRTHAGWEYLVTGALWPVVGITAIWYDLTYEPRTLVQ